MPHANRLLPIRPSQYEDRDTLLANGQNVLRYPSAVTLGEPSHNSSRSNTMRPAVSFTLYYVLSSALLVLD
jgi:hypothetical protein